MVGSPLVGNIIDNIFLFLHFVGLAALLGGLLAQFRESFRTVTATLGIGAVTQLVTGLVLVALNLDDINHVKVAVKLGVLVVIGVVLLMRRGKPLAPVQYALLLVLTAGNVAVAVFWH